MFLPAKNTHGPIAIDIGAGGLRAVQMERRNGKLAVRHWASLVVPSIVAPADKPSSAKKGDAQAAKPAEITNALPPVLDREAFLGDEVVVAINPPDVDCTPLRVPDNLLKLERHVLLIAIRHEVSRNINIPIEESETDIWPLVPGHRDSPNLMVAAARREAIIRTLAWLESQKLICRRIDAGPLAALRICSRTPQRHPDDHLWGVLDVGRSAVRLYVGMGDTPVYVRCMSRSGDEMTRRISEELGVDIRTAESYKRHYGVHASTDAGSRADSHYRPLNAGEDAVDSHRMAGILHGTLRPIIRGIGEEIQRSFRYAMGLYLDRPIAGLWVIGQGANMRGLTETLGSMLGIKVRRLTTGDLPSDFIIPSSITDEVTSQLAMCMGLCLGEMCP